MLKINTFLSISLFILLTGCSQKQKKNAAEARAAQNVAKPQTNTSVSSDETSQIDPFDNALLGFKNDSALMNASVGLLVIDDLTQKEVASINPDLSLVPASTLKLFTTAAALEILSSKRHFYTYIEYDGEIEDDHILNGNIYIRGGGDPALGSKYFNEHYDDFIEKWCLAIIKAGIDTINGAVIADAQIFDEDFVPETWSWGELGDYYSTAASGLSVYDNVFDLTFNPSNYGIFKSTPTNTEPYIPDLFFENKIRINSREKTNLYLVGAPYSFWRVITGYMRRKKTEYTITATIPDPPYQVAFELERKLLRHPKCKGITKPATTLRRLRHENDTLYQKIKQNKRTLITKTVSPSVGSIVYYTNRRSKNLFAEHLLKHIGRVKKNNRNHDEAIKALVDFCEHSAGIDISGMHLFDGSGISRYNAVTARQLVTILDFMKHRSPNYAVFFSSLPVSGQSGTLRYFCRGTAAEGKIHAKSGSMSRVRSYAGYINTNNDNQLIFAITVNNFNCTMTEMRHKIEDLMTAFVTYK